ncbi:uncharacterized protein BDR25DRAFT_327860 [Lindgomyces ingoldianus]|uniref:Uncharacterized protein n=1 Tax=Lindgomyces ingoldianus TaxID=673940 RepID=A0ACB6QIF6_9PLEO|nr:uncharacterized protein BDR25DRAFT_327860 [Lindgomyces ingoldianus]KAF2466799.1 hypothetical protein BDR25DRAFT_327860 [Lindgomyces ingoldianus]
MPAMLEDPTAPIMYRTSGEMPYPIPGATLPQGIVPRQVTLRDRVTIATIIPFSTPNQVPLTLLAYLADQFSREIEKGDTYPMLDPLPLESFGPYWFGVFGAVMILGDVHNIDEVHHMVRTGRDWEKECLGSFYIKPNYPGRSSHVCNGGFLVTDASRNRGVGRLMGETYLEWAPKLGYTYSVFNLVYETNVASCRIWDALGFKRIGRVKGCGNLKSYPGELVDAIIYGRDLGQDDDFVSEERFDKIRFYLKNGKYPNGADRAEKSRLRSAATHYKLIPAEGDRPEKLVLKGKEVISDPQRQYEIARTVHHKSHGGINKTTAAIAEAYHWVRIKETVSQVIRNCPECSEMNKGLSAMREREPTRSPSPSDQLQMEAAQHAQHTQMMDPVPQYNNYDMPVDPALMDGVNQTANLEDLPPSPFLAAGRGLPMPPLPSLDSPNPVARKTEDTPMSGVEVRAPTAKEELRRRLTRAGYGANK